MCRASSTVRKCFHSLWVVAPLKGGMPKLSVDDITCFHSLWVVAPLKGPSELRLPLPQVEFPQPLGCGSIEGSTIQGQCNSDLEFPQPLGCGSIEGAGELCARQLVS